MHHQNQNPDQQAEESKQEIQKANERRIDELMKISNRYVRTERHLEQHSDIVDKEDMDHSLDLQQERMDRMQNLKNIIAYDKHEEVDEKSNLKKRLEYSQNYLQRHAGHMDQDTVQHAQEKQEHRKEQLDFLD